MSAIFGILNLDEKPIPSDAIECMRKTLSHRGPDGSGVWCDGAVMLGHQMMHITPESLHEKLPLRHAEADVVITANARIDNREALFEVLGVPHTNRAEMPDSTLILKAYLKWGEDCPSHLLGDFAFAIWDGRKRKLFCVTDHMGMRPIFYYQNQRQFVFASEIKGILSVPGVPKRLNEKKVASMAFPVAMVLNKETTFFDGIFMLSPATVMTVSAEGVKKLSYWEPSPATNLNLKTDEAYIEAFRELFFQVVAARIRSAFPVTAMLSGGLDSSAIVAVAARILKDQGKRLIAISAVLPENNQDNLRDERHYIDLFRDWENIDIQYVTDMWRGPFDDIEQLVWSCESPYKTSRHYMYTAFVDAARRKNARVMLDGRGGELGPSFRGDGYLGELLLKGHWKTLVREIKCIAKQENTSSWSIFKASLKPLLPSSILKLINRAPRFDLHQWEENHLLKREFVNCHLGKELVQLLTTRHALEKIYPNHLKNQWKVVRLVRGQIETWCIGYEHISMVTPFFDKRVIEFCLAVPGNLKVRDGFKRYFIRATMHNLLPPKIQWRTSKEPFSPDYHLRYNRHKERAYQLLTAISPTNPIRDIVEVDKLKAIVLHEMSGNRDNTPTNFAAMHLIPIGIYLSVFLQQFDTYQ